jgi:hypothetical protein
LFFVSPPHIFRVPYHPLPFFFTGSVLKLCNTLKPEEKDVRKIIED